MLLLILLLQQLGGQVALSPVDEFLSTNFEIISSTASFPVSVTPDEDKVMANPGARWNATDVIDDTTLSSQRLIFAGKADSLWFVYYEQGGFGYSINLVIFRPQEKTEITPLWCGSVGAKKVRDIESLKTLLRTLPCLTVADLKGKAKIPKDKILLGSVSDCRIVLHDSH